MKANHGIRNHVPSETTSSYRRRLNNTPFHHMETSSRKKSFPSRHAPSRINHHLFRKRRTPPSLRQPGIRTFPPSCLKGPRRRLCHCATILHPRAPRIRLPVVRGPNPHPSRTTSILSPLAAPFPAAYQRNTQPASPTNRFRAERHRPENQGATGDKSWQNLPPRDPPRTPSIRHFLVAPRMDRYPSLRRSRTRTEMRHDREMLFSKHLFAPIRPPSSMMRLCLHRTPESVRHSIAPTNRPRWRMLKRRIAIKFRHRDRRSPSRPVQNRQPDPNPRPHTMWKIVSNKGWTHFFSVSHLRPGRSFQKALRPIRGRHPNEDGSWTWSAAHWNATHHSISNLLYSFLEANLRRTWKVGRSGCPRRFPPKTRAERWTDRAVTNCQAFHHAPSTQQQTRRDTFPLRQIILQARILRFLQPPTWRLWRLKLATRRRILHDSTSAMEISPRQRAPRFRNEQPRATPPISIGAWIPLPPRTPRSRTNQFRHPNKLRLRVMMSLSALARSTSGIPPTSLRLR